jgi:hypothetical protein
MTQSKVENNATTKILEKEYKELRKKAVLKHCEIEIKRILKRGKTIKKAPKRNVEYIRQAKYSPRLIAKITTDINAGLVNFAQSKGITDKQIEDAQLNKYLEGMNRNKIGNYNCIIDKIEYNISFEGNSPKLTNIVSKEVIPNAIVERERVFDITIDEKTTTIIVDNPPQ